jgi:hypothetical protein
MFHFVWEPSGRTVSDYVTKAVRPNTRMRAAY